MKTLLLKGRRSLINLGLLGAAILVVGSCVTQLKAAPAAAPEACGGGTCPLDGDCTTRPFCNYCNPFNNTCAWLDAESNASASKR
jgi:hypothetical protein